MINLKSEIEKLKKVLIGFIFLVLQVQVIFRLKDDIKKSRINKFCIFL